MTGLYIHVPFCTKKCHYCNFVIAPAAPAGDHAAFLASLERQAMRYAPALAGTAFDTVYLGGGTPSVLEPAELERLFGILRAHFAWKPDAEITCEANPGDVDAAKASLLTTLGVNRVSLGAQSFHDPTLAKLNRSHDADDIAVSFRHLRGAGIRNINLDLILSLPGESWEHAHVSLERAVSLDPEHVSLYELSVEPNTVFGDRQAKGTLALPDEEEQFEILSNARRFLQRRGYRHYELLNYAKPGCESRHNLLYWANEDTIGLGPGAYTYFRGRRYRFSETHAQYVTKIASNDWEPAEQETLSDDKREIESFLLALRLTEGAPASRFGRVLERFGGEIAGLEEKGLLSRDAGKIRLSARGQFLAESVFAELSC